MDITDTIIAKSDQLTVDDFGGGPRTIKINKIEVVEGEQPVTIYCDGGDGKHYRPGKSMRRVIVKAWGPDVNKYIGRMITLYIDDKVTWGGQEVGGIRISHMTNLKNNEPLVVSLTASRKNKKPFTVKPLVVKEEPHPIIKGALEAAGALAAASGIQSYKDWLGTLTKEQKEVIKPYHSEWSKVAKEAVG